MWSITFSMTFTGQWGCALTKDVWCLFLCSLLTSSKVIKASLFTAESIKKMQYFMNKYLVNEIRQTLYRICVIPLLVIEYNITPDTLVPVQTVSAPIHIVLAGSDISQRTHKGCRAALLATPDTQGFWDNVYQDSICLSTETKLMFSQVRYSLYTQYTHSKKS